MYKSLRTVVREAVKAAPKEKKNDPFKTGKLKDKPKESDKLTVGGKEPVQIKPVLAGDTTMKEDLNETEDRIIESLYFKEDLGKYSEHQLQTFLNKHQGKAAPGTVHKFQVDAVTDALKAKSKKKQ